MPQIFAYIKSYTQEACPDWWKMKIITTLAIIVEKSIFRMTMTWVIEQNKKVRFLTKLWCCLVVYLHLKAYKNDFWCSSVAGEGKSLWIFWNVMVEKCHESPKVIFPSVVDNDGDGKQWICFFKATESKFLGNQKQKIVF